MRGNHTPAETEYGERWDVFCAVPDGTRSILDVGCGTGLGFQSYRKRGARLVGVDYDPACVEAARGRMDDARAFDLERDSWPDEWRGAFDVVAFCDVLEHLTDPWLVLASVRPLLSGRGVVVASIPNVRQWRLIAKLALGRWEYVRGGGTIQRGHYTFFTRQTVRDLFAEAGFEPPRFSWPRETFHLRPADRALHMATLGRIPDLWYGSYTVSARPKDHRA